MAIELLKSGERTGYFSPNDPGEPVLGTARGSVTDAEGEILSRMVEGLSLVLEIGTGLGVSTRYMAKTARIVYTCDIDPWVWHNIWPELAELGNVHFCTKSEHAPMANLIFVDGLHDYESVIHDIGVAMDKIMPPGKIVCHDHKFQPGVKQALLEYGCNHFVASYYGLGIIDVR